MELNGHIDHLYIGRVPRLTRAFLKAVKLVILNFCFATATGSGVR